MPQRQQQRKSGDPFEASRRNGGKRSSQPLLHQDGVEIQRFGTIRDLPIGLDHKARAGSCDALNQTLADSIILYNLYKKHHWLVRGHTFYQLHLLLDKHAGEQLELVDLLAERVQTLGGIAVADPRQVAEVTRIPRPPDGAEELPAMLSRLLEAHELIIVEARGRRDGRAGRRPGHQRPAGLRGGAHQRAADLVRGRAPGRHAAGQGVAARGGRLRRARPAVSAAGRPAPPAR